MPANTAIRRAATETLTIPALRILSSSATEKERVAFIKQHIRAIELCGRRTIQHAWLVGRELAPACGAVSGRRFCEQPGPSCTVGVASGCEHHELPRQALVGNRSEHPAIDRVDTEPRGGPVTPIDRMDRRTDAGAFQRLGVVSHGAP